MARIWCLVIIKVLKGLEACKEAVLERKMGDTFLVKWVLPIHPKNKESCRITSMNEA